jgi:hypothetical protein
MCRDKSAGACILYGLIVAADYTRSTRACLELLARPASLPPPAADRQSEIVLRNSEQSHRRTAEDCCLVGCRDRQCLDLPYTFERPHVEGIVASQQHALRLARGQQKLERPSMHDGVEQELVHRRMRRRFQSCPRLCSDLPSVIEAPGLVRHETASVHHQEFDPRIAFDHATEHQPPRWSYQGDCRSG